MYLKICADSHVVQGTMLPGFVQGVTGMGVGERRLIQIPWKLGYGRLGCASGWRRWECKLSSNIGGQSFDKNTITTCVFLFF